MKELLYLCTKNVHFSLTFIKLWKHYVEDTTTFVKTDEIKNIS